MATEEKKNATGAPSVFAEMQRLRNLHGWPMGKCLRVATETVRAWAVANGFAD